MKRSVQAPTRKLVAVPSEYRPLHKYLDERFANTVVLTFSEIEDLLGCTLPVPARAEPGWWDNPDLDHTASTQSLSWTQASRTAKVNLLAQTVVFDRLSE